MRLPTALQVLQVLQASNTFLPVKSLCGGGVPSSQVPPLGCIFSFLLSHTILSFWSCLSRARVSKPALAFGPSQSAKMPSRCTLPVRLLSHSSAGTRLKAQKDPPKRQSQHRPSTGPCRCWCSPREREELSNDMCRRHMKERRVESLIPSAAKISIISPKSRRREKNPLHVPTVALLP